MEATTAEGGAAEVVPMDTAEPTTEPQPADDAQPATDGQKRVYTEEERLKRKAYFKQLREKRAKRKFGTGPTPRNTRLNKPGPKKDIVSFKFSEEDDKVLNFYKVKLSALKSTNDQLHKRLAFLVRENMQLLQMGPPLKRI